MNLEKFDLEDGDVISATPDYRLINNPTGKVKEIANAILASHANNNLKHWLEGNIACEVLRTQGGGWITGKARIKTVIEFIPDELEATDIIVMEENTEQSTNEINALDPN